MRKLLLALMCLFFMTGVVLAAEYTLVKYDKDKKELTVKDKDDKEVTLKLTDKTKFNVIDKDGNKTEGKLENVEKMLGNEKLAGKAKFDITTEKDEITEMILKRGKGK